MIDECYTLHTPYAFRNTAKMNYEYLGMKLDPSF